MIDLKIPGYSSGACYILLLFTEYTHALDEVDRKPACVCEKRYAIVEEDRKAIAEVFNNRKKLSGIKRF